LFAFIGGGVAGGKGIITALPWARKR
jgi:hypothetical protein